MLEYDLAAQCYSARSQMLSRLQKGLTSSLPITGACWDPARPSGLLLNDSSALYVVDTKRLASDESSEETRVCRTGAAKKARLNVTGLQVRTCGRSYQAYTAHCGGVIPLY